MTLGYSGSFGVNGINFILQPSVSKWGNRDELGIDGNGHPIYAAFREYELTWALAHPSDVKQLIDVYNTLGNTGTAAFDLPQWGADDWYFASYSGCTINEPKVGQWFNGYYTNVKLTVMKVRA